MGMLGLGGGDSGGGGGGEENKQANSTGTNKNNAKNSEAAKGDSFTHMVASLPSVPASVNEFTAGFGASNSYGLTDLQNATAQNTAPYYAGAVIGAIPGFFTGSDEANATRALVKTGDAVLDKVLEQGASFKSFRALKDALGTEAGSQWHHIVEQTSSNISKLVKRLFKTLPMLFRQLKKHISGKEVLVLFTLANKHFRRA